MAQLTGVWHSRLCRSVFINSVQLHSKWVQNGLHMFRLFFEKLIQNSSKFSKGHPAVTFAEAERSTQSSPITPSTINWARMASLNPTANAFSPPIDTPWTIRNPGAVEVYSICKFHNAQRGNLCKYGDNCRYIHYAELDRPCIATTLTCTLRDVSSDRCAHSKH